MANWRRERESTTVHVVPEAAPALCGFERELGATVWDAGVAAPDLCRDCSRKILAATNEAVRLTENVRTNLERDLAKQALRSLLRIVPDGVTRDLIMYARACLVRGDLTDAHESVVRWRANMRAIGVFGQDD